MSNAILGLQGLLAPLQGRSDLFWAPALALRPTGELDVRAGEDVGMRCRKGVDGQRQDAGHGEGDGEEMHSGRGRYGWGGREIKLEG